MIEITNILDVEKYLDDIKVAIFDLDDTLYSEKDYVKSGYNAIAKGFPQIENMATKLWTVFEKGGKAIDEVLFADGLLTDSNKAHCLEIYRFHRPYINLYSGVRDMLLRIKKRGILLGLITDGRPEGQHAKIEALDIGNLFDYITITDELGGVEFRKPCSKAFIKMHSQVNCSYKEMVYIGDNVKKDFQAPISLGMQSIYYKNPLGLYAV